MTHFIKKDVLIQAEYGLHTRPAAIFVKQAAQFQSDIQVICEGKQANAKSLFQLQLLGLSKGVTITLQAQGNDAVEAIEQLSKWFYEFK